MHDRIRGSSRQRSVIFSPLFSQFDERAYELKEKHWYIVKQFHSREYYHVYCCLLNI